MFVEEHAVIVSLGHLERGLDIHMYLVTWEISVCYTTDTWLPMTRGGVAAFRQYGWSAQAMYDVYGDQTMIYQRKIHTVECYSPVQCEEGGGSHE